MPASGRATTITESGRAEQPQDAPPRDQGLLRGRAGRAHVRRPRTRACRRAAEQVVVTATSPETPARQAAREPARRWSTEADLEPRARDGRTAIARGSGAAQSERSTTAPRRNASGRSEPSERAAAADARIDPRAAGSRSLEAALRGPASARVQRRRRQRRPGGLDRRLRLRQGPGLRHAPRQRRGGRADDAHLPESRPDRDACPGRSTSPRAARSSGSSSRCRRPRRTSPGSRSSTQPVTGASGGPYPLETGVTQLCNYEFDFIYSYAVFTSGAPAGPYGLRVIGDRAEQRRLCRAARSCRCGWPLGRPARPA